MSLRSRLQKLERTFSASDPLADDPEYQSCRLFYETALGSIRFHVPFAASVDVKDARNASRTAVAVAISRSLP